MPSGVSGPDGLSALGGFIAAINNTYLKSFPDSGKQKTANTVKRSPLMSIHFSSNVPLFFQRPSSNKRTNLYNP
jgi:hypothetical protein